MLVSRGSRTAALAACATILLATSACGSDKPEETTAQQARLYGTDGNMLNSFPAELKDRADLVNGMKGTTPATPLPEEFKSRLQSVDPKLGDYLYSAETYDAIVISALAAQLAGSTDSTKIAQQIVGVTNGGERCENVAACLSLAQAGRDIEYRGVSVTRSGFTDAGEPATTSYATLHFDGERLNDGKTEFVGAGDESAASTKAPPKASKQGKNPVPGAPLVIAGLFPKTGDLALAYPPMAAGATLAIKEINAAGGVLGKKVTWLEGDDGASATKAKATVAELIEGGADVIIGAASSGISLAVLPETVQAGKVLFSPSSTDDGLTTAEDKGLFFRTAPPDSLQGRALADVILRDGSQRIAIVARKDSYGEGLQSVVKAELEKAGIAGDRIKLLTYEPQEGESAPPVDFTTGAKEVKDFGADAVLVIGFGESAQVIRALADAGVEMGS
ncbi:ABC transporter substrate-binding protein [Micromonospora avicenniae]|uniref:Amino acid/amide ABC transporter substrate-binding protein, HAAT family n=1 Tax=Micromonospora avicenniae TaxID=1198245 RepID=A0A1N6U9Z7_9ACTN|nr:ABC transporter substrate-binding protein [Micromonospora avicenniae]SIQ62341.1 amino acid/amide ABC transporter substrate-binding protein, HAAT family [Micromonospora avicenniae]